MQSTNGPHMPSRSMQVEPGFKTAAALWGRGVWATGEPCNLSSVCFGLKRELDDIIANGDSMNSPIPVELQTANGRLFALACKCVDQVHLHLGEKEAASLFGPIQSYYLGFIELLQKEQEKIQAKLARSDEGDSVARRALHLEDVSFSLRPEAGLRNGNIHDLSNAEELHQLRREAQDAIHWAGLNIAQIRSIIGPAPQTRSVSHALDLLRETIQRSERAVKGLTELQRFLIEP